MTADSSTYRIHDLHETERPRERLATLGPQSLSTAELLAILLRVGVQGENAVQVGQRLLQKFGGLQGLHRSTLHEIQNERGIGFAKASALKAAIELGRRLALAAPEDRPQISSPRDVDTLLAYEMRSYQEERLKVILLDTKNHVVEIVEIYKGTINSSVVRVAEIFTPAIRRKAASIIVVHNHPSGDPTPSIEDLTVTRAIIAAGTLLEIDVLDHIVVGMAESISMKEKGYAFQT